MTNIMLMINTVKNLGMGDVLITQCFISLNCLSEQIKQRQHDQILTNMETYHITVIGRQHLPIIQRTTIFRNVYQ